MDNILSICNHFICFIFYFRFLWLILFKKKITNTIIQVRETNDSTSLRSIKNSFADAVKTAIPSVVNINTAIKIRYNSNPFFEDPFLESFLVIN